MSFGKMNMHIEIVGVEKDNDEEGFSTSTDTVLRTVRAYKEDRHGTVSWANRAAFSTATCLFRFRAIPGLSINTSHIIICSGVRYKINSVEDVKQRGMYIEVLAEKQEGTMR